MTDATLPFDRDTLEAMNAKAIQNQFFTPDHVYIDLTLIKDIPLGVAYADTLQHRGEAHFDKLQSGLMEVISDYQKRLYDTVDPYLGSFGYTDQKIDDLLDNCLSHDLVFSVSPTTTFFNTLIRHTVRNQNNSGPANKFVKKAIDAKQYTLDPVAVTYYLNIYPLNLSPALLSKLAPELGEALGVNLHFVNKDPMLFNQHDWDKWLKKIDCFYLNSLGRFTRGDFILEKQGEMSFSGCYFFARKRFETCVMADMANVDFEQQIQLITAQIDMMCDFAWLQNNDVRLTEEAEDVPLDIDVPDQDNGTPS